MYLPGQIIYDLDKKVPVCIGPDVWDLEAYPKRSTHFIADTGLFGPQLKGEHTKVFVLITPKSVEEAQDLLDKNLIVPAPVRPDHCWNTYHDSWQSSTPPAHHGETE